MKEKNTGIRRKILFIFHKRRSVCRDGEKAFPLYAGAPDLLRSAFPWGKVAAKRPDEGRWGLMVSASPLPPSQREVAPKVPVGVSCPQK